MKISVFALLIFVLSSAFTVKYCSAGADFPDRHDPLPPLSKQLGDISAEARKVQPEQDKEKTSSRQAFNASSEFSFKKAARRYDRAGRPVIDDLHAVWKLVCQARAGGEALCDMKGITGSNPYHHGLVFFKEHKSFLDERALLFVSYLDEIMSLNGGSVRESFMARKSLQNKGPYEVKFSFEKVSFRYEGCGGDCRFHYECRKLDEDRLLCAVRSKTVNDKEPSPEPDTYVGYMRQ